MTDEQMGITVFYICTFTMQRQTSCNSERSNPFCSIVNSINVYHETTTHPLVMFNWESAFHEGKEKKLTEDFAHHSV